MGDGHLGGQFDGGLELREGLLQIALGEELLPRLDVNLGLHPFDLRAAGAPDGKACHPDDPTSYSRGSATHVISRLNQSLPTQLRQ